MRRIIHLLKLASCASTSSCSCYSPIPFHPHPSLTIIILIISSLLLLPLDGDGDGGLGRLAVKAHDAESGGSFATHFIANQNSCTNPPSTHKTGHQTVKWPAASCATSKRSRRRRFPNSIKSALGNVVINLIVSSSAASCDDIGCLSHQSAPQPEPPPQQLNHFWDGSGVEWLCGNLINLPNRMVRGRGDSFSGKSFADQLAGIRRRNTRRTEMKGGKTGVRLLGSSEVAIPNVCTYGCCPGGLLRLFKMLLEMHQPQRSSKSNSSRRYNTH